MTSTIRPVTRRFPASQDCLDASNLPFSCVLSPLLEEEEDDDSESTLKDGSHKTSRSIQALMGISKCLHCGAPHPDQTTHFALLGGASSLSTSGPMAQQLLCFLCGRVSSLKHSEQQAVRAPLESGGTGRGASALPEERRSRRPPLSATFALPLRLQTTTTAAAVGGSSHHQQHVTSTTSPLYSVPATTCPPLWFIVLDGSCTQRLYWRTVSQVLQQTLQEAPPHVHVSLIIANQQQKLLSTTRGENSHNTSAVAATEEDALAEESSVAIFQLNSATPHVLQYSSNAALSRQEDLLQAVVDSLVPVEQQQQRNGKDTNNSTTTASTTKSHALSAVRSLMDYIPEAAYSTTREEVTTATTTTTTITTHAPPVAWMTQVILAALEMTAVPAGQRHRDQPAPSGSGTSMPQPLRPYMGGKITYFLSKRPAGLSSTHKKTTRVGDMGGFGGRVSQEPAGSRFVTAAGAMIGNNENQQLPQNGMSADDVEQNQPTGSSTIRSSAVEWTPTGLQQHYQPLEDNMELFYADLGRQCAEAALGVDLLCLATETEPEQDSGPCSAPDFGLALCQSLSDKSGAPGPLLFDLSASLREATVARLQQELLSRSPWQHGRVFGAELRIRLSPGFEVDHQSVEFEKKYKTEPQLAPLYCEAGLVGPATPVEDSTHLWRMGTSDQFTSLTVDFSLQRRKVKDRFIVDGYGEVRLRPVIQTCLAYTTNVQDEAGNYHTVRRMRIASQSVPLTNRVEDLYDSLDPEALAVVLFHKLAIASFQEGLLEAQIIAQNWLESLLACAYHSAEEQALIVKQEAEKGVGSDETSVSRYFVASERLLDREGELPAEDVLLAQGHKKLAPIPLMVFLLLQSDPLRPNPTVSLDLRVAALWQMASMLPTNLARAIAPRLQLWASGNGDGAEEPILDIIDLNSTAVQDAVMEFIQQKATPGILLFLDSPDQILVMNAHQIVSDQVAPPVVEKKPKRSSSWFGGSSHSRKDEETPIGAVLKRTIDEAVFSYRTRPVVQYSLKDDDLLLSRLADVLVEDVPMRDGENFAAWRRMIAAAVNEDLLETA